MAKIKNPIMILNMAFQFDIPCTSEIVLTKINTLQIPSTSPNTAKLQNTDVKKRLESILGVYSWKFSSPNKSIDIVPNTTDTSDGAIDST